ncbi:hypothetical protein GCK72_000727 [Caenorhabditis remanei]|uniref:SPK domain-containing protein n=1 Tax=Caenorhabditis remanei TaxID=31234 RepID=A0A6A5HQM6_CAERE|nr:hypothetical protein GCK72_000727 [Caenorhabditis remanei]KAF1768914.1 hypothetical protein GCK72_000727 [Caenorhabditis remanei]
MDLLEFLKKESLLTVKPLSILQLARKFKRMSGSSTETELIETEIYGHQRRIPTYSEIDWVTRIRMMFTLGYIIYKEEIKEWNLHKYGEIKLNQSSRILAFVPKDKSYRLEGDFDEILAEEERMDCHIANGLKSEDDLLFLKFIAEKSLNVTAPLTIISLCDEYIKECGVPKTINTLQGYVRQIRSAIPHTIYFDLERKVKMMFAISAKIEKEFLAELQKDAFVALDDQQHIIEYRSNDNSIHLKGFHDSAAKVGTRGDDFIGASTSTKKPFSYTPQQCEDLFDHLARRAFQATEPLNVKRLISNYNKDKGITQSKLPMNAFISSLFETIKAKDDWSLQQRVRMLFVLGVKLDSDYVTVLEKKADVVTDYDMRITKYSSHRDKFHLEGINEEKEKEVEVKADEPMRRSRRTNPVVSEDQKPFGTPSKKLKLEPKNEEPSETPPDAQDDADRTRNDVAEPAVVKSEGTIPLLHILEGLKMMVEELNSLNLSADIKKIDKSLRDAKNKDLSILVGHLDIALQSCFLLSTKRLHNVWSAESEKPYGEFVRIFNKTISSWNSPGLAELQTIINGNLAEKNKKFVSMGSFSSGLNHILAVIIP